MRYEDSLVGLSHLHTIQMDTSASWRLNEIQLQEMIEALFGALEPLQVVRFLPSLIEWRRNGTGAVQLIREAAYSWLN